MLTARWLAPLILGLAGLVFYGGAWPQGSNRVPTVTRLVKIFAELESKLDDATASGDKSAIGTLLADDFEMRVGYAPGTPVPRSDWIDALQSQRNLRHRAEQIAVHDQGNVAIVSFLQSADPKTSAPLFIVDVWKRSGEDWKLATRYAGAANNVAIPGASSEKSTIPKKY